MTMDVTHSYKYQSDDTRKLFENQILSNTLIFVLVEYYYCYYSQIKLCGYNLLFQAAWWDLDFQCVKGAISSPMYDIVHGTNTKPKLHDAWNLLGEQGFTSSNIVLLTVCKLLCKLDSSMCIQFTLYQSFTKHTNVNTQHKLP